MPEIPCDTRALAKSIEAGAAERDRPALVGIDGPGGTGKSTLAALLAACLPGAVVVHIDDFYLPSADRPARSGAIAAGFDLARLDDQVLRPAVAGRRVRYQRYDWDADRLGDWIELPPRTPLIVEGVHALHADLRPAYTHTIHCQAPRDVRLHRGLARDGEEARTTWEDEWMPAEDAYLAAHRPHLHADTLLDSHTRPPAPDGTPRYTLVTAPARGRATGAGGTGRPRPGGARWP
ncbi:uridine kinase [Streptomyces sp. NBC_00091]|uniref:uridine kinase family protein n=1 Tax=Streptomyces sp. NBC_00091 TaxID=2975648 RepID=UPI00225397B2|nr:uridine kinase [Streptomyces sp. NBC_00091]MCX5380479.1 uridine kinase [Streptomyces sp. NBC_00091]